MGTRYYSILARRMHYWLKTTLEIFNRASLFLLLFVVMCWGNVYGDAHVPLSFEERLFWQEEIEKVFWRHRIWPESNSQIKPAFEEVFTEDALRSKVEKIFLKSDVLDNYWHRPVTGKQLQEEMDRMARQTRNPEMLRELWQALQFDPYLIAECLVRPWLVDRLLQNWFLNDDRFQGEVKTRALSELNETSCPDAVHTASGKYHETEWGHSSCEVENSSHHDRFTRQRLLNDHEWGRMIKKLYRTFNIKENDTDNGHEVFSSALEDHVSPLNKLSPDQNLLPLNEMSTLQEDTHSYYVDMILENEKCQLKVATIRWEKVSLEQWLADKKTGSSHINEPSFEYVIPQQDRDSCELGDWTPMGIFERSGHTAVWTGSEMIVWGGLPYTYTGFAYNPGTASWRVISSNGMPKPMEYHTTAVWTGTEMIVWGGYNYDLGEFGSGARYNPSTDTWFPTNLTNAPVPRTAHTAVWTGAEMIVWGGYANNSGGRYNPVDDSWTATSTHNVPSSRSKHTAVWTGDEMIVWGGYPYNTGTFIGGRYNPDDDTWTSMTTVDSPSQRSSHTAVWTGAEMIVWGGNSYLSTGGRYNPNSDIWIPTTVTDAPAGRYQHTAVWTGSHMIVWGGRETNSELNTGGNYDPGTDIWMTTSTLNAPTARGKHTAVWTGTEMIAWGGENIGTDLCTGGRYDPILNSWVPTESSAAPSLRYDHSAVWTGAEMIIWGGYTHYFGYSSYPINSGGRYFPVIDTWLDTSMLNAPPPSGRHSAIWTGSEMIVWGGGYYNTGGRYSPVLDLWLDTATTGAPSPRGYHTAVWTGAEMIVWGGYSSEGIEKTGGRFNPQNNVWIDTNIWNAPTERCLHTAIWTGSEMIVWGGLSGGNETRTGARYSPFTNSWQPTSLKNGPTPRQRHTAVWTGSEMIVWGGYCYFLTEPEIYPTDGRCYNPVLDLWSTVSLFNAPSPRINHTAVWTGSEMLVWGGMIPYPYDYIIGASYDTVSNSWTDLPVINAPPRKSNHTAVATGSEMIVWGGNSSNTGGRYCYKSTHQAVPEISSSTIILILSLFSLLLIGRKRNKV